MARTSFVMQKPAIPARWALLMLCTALTAAALLSPRPAAATTPLGDQPPFTNAGVPGNLALTLSVEYPTAVSVAHTDTLYNSAKTYLGYFDPRKCYLYNWDAAEEKNRYFYPAGLATNRTCTGVQDNKWSGNFMNWATMQTIDPFRWALTGGYRVKDDSTITLLEKAWASGQGGGSNFPNRVAFGNGLVAGAVPFAWSQMYMRIQNLGNKMRFSYDDKVDSGDPVTVYNPANAVNTSKVYEVSVRVKVCDASASAGPMEPNCRDYPAGTYKPTGLIQQYASKIRYSTFGYLNDSNKQRDGGVLRARQKFVSPTYTLPGQVQAANAAAEWDADTGIFTLNPDTADASATNAATGVAVANSGVINYINKFGQITQGDYKTYDNVSELYYAALRYYKNLGNVPEWTSMAGATAATKTTWVDGFPVITDWDDPIQYSCQRNFVLGIGDVNTWLDKNLPGATGNLGEPSKPALVSADNSVDAKVATDKVGALHGNNASLGSATNAVEIPGSYYIAGLAYDANAKDIRPDTAGKPQTTGKQTVQTYWLDVLEYSTYKADNMYYLATKFGGAKLPDPFDPYARAADLPLAWWSTTGEKVGGQDKPDNYFTAAKADEMVSGLTRAFASIAANLRAFTTSFSTALPQVSTLGASSYSAQYDASTWSGELSAANATFDAASGQPSTTVAWNFSGKLAVQAAGTGWDTGRRIASWNSATNTGVPFRAASLSLAQNAALDTAYRLGEDSADYLNYLRGQTKHEEGSADTDSAAAYRARSSLVGDIIGSKPRTVAAPVMPFSSSANPGYGTFKATWASRKPMVYVGSNSGMLHAVDGALAGASAGTEVFAYVPGAVIAGPTGEPQTTGLAARGNPDFTHRYFVDGTPSIFDIDLGRTQGGSGTDWRTLLVGGLGKGGKSYYALDITNPAAMITEAVVASKVMWEFSDPDLGYTYGEPSAVKTKKYGWVLIFGSGYNNSNGQGYFFIVNPRTGALLEKIGTGAGTVAGDAGLAHVQAFVLDRSDNTADSVYGGDLLGNLWRLDLRAASGAYPAPTKLATLTDTSNNPRPVTSRPSLIVQPVTNTRWVTVGTGRLLDTSDVSSTQAQAMYAIQDGTGLAFAAAAPAGFSYPITPAKLKQLTDLTLPVVLNTATQIGWYVDLGVSGGGLGWRVISDPSSFYGSVEFTTMLPSGEACNPTGSSRVYAIDLGTGQSALVGNDGVTPIAYNSSLVGAATEQRSYAVNDGSTTPKRRYVACTSSGGCSVIKTKQPTALGLRRLNWRELPLAN